MQAQAKQKKNQPIINDVLNIFTIFLVAAYNINIFE
jgi:hypothetical protein